VNWDAIGAIGEIIGAIAVVLTLGYLAVQTRHNAASTQSSTEIEASRQFSSWVSRITQNPNLQRIWDDAQANKSLSPEDYRQWLWMIADYFHMTEGIFIQHEKGFVSDEVWSEFERAMLGFLQLKSTQDWWDGRNSPFSDSFRRYGNDLMAKKPDWSLPNVAGTQTNGAQSDSEN